MPFSAKIITDSISPEGIRLTTMELFYPRFIHSEFMTHRVFSRNASSSRAIPVSRMLKEIKINPAMPIYWGANKPGMQAGEEVDQQLGRDIWLEALDYALDHAEDMMSYGFHKQIVNRLIEPFAHIRVVVTATDWSNFFALRRHPDAQPEIHHLANLMAVVMDESKPDKIDHGMWHLPYVTDEDWEAGHDTETLKKISVARCARVSYRTHEGKPTALADDLALYERLVGSHPMHASPAEHQATPDKKGEFPCDMPEGMDWVHPELHGNFTGWIQYRKTLKGESQ